MATSKTPEPLTEEEQKQYDALVAKKSAADIAAQEELKREQLSKLATVQALLKLVDVDKIQPAIAAVIEDPNVDFATKQQVQNFSDSLRYNMGAVVTMMSSLSTPA